MRSLTDLIKDVLWTIVIAGLVAAVIRFGLGLGAATGLNDSSPWGLWIAFKLGFVALAGGAFTLAGMVYVFHLETFRPILHRAILLGLLGYGSFIVSLLFDLGLPWHIYMPIISWQEHSVMFEIAWCVMLYFTVLVFEFTPHVLDYAWFSRPVFRKISSILHFITVPLVIAGIVLSTLHQSSLGALFLIMPQRVHPLWYSPLIPVIFFISAIAAGIMALIIESFLSEKLFRTKIQPDLLENLAKIGAFVLWIYLVIRISDLVFRKILPRAMDGSWQSLLFIIEVLIGGLLPAVLLSINKFRSSRAGLLTAGLLAIAGIISQRMSLSLFTMWRPPEAPYHPSGLEIVLAFAIPAAAGLIYFLFVEHLPVFNTGRVEPVSKTKLISELPFFEGSLKGTLARRSGIAIFAIAFTIVLIPSRFASGESMPFLPASPALGWSILLIDADRDGYAVQFPHVDHQDRLSSDQPDKTDACKQCHHLSLPNDEATPCSECHVQFYRSVTIFDHSHHQNVLGGNDSCSQCHDGEHTANNVVDCVECHSEMTPPQGETVFDPTAVGYLYAVHSKCIDCHTEEAEERNQPMLANCGTCHKTIKQDLIQARSNSSSN
jgi:Ni/Fe-hydrogenase subunit HybB-like protein